MDYLDLLTLRDDNAIVLAQVVAISGTERSCAALLRTDERTGQLGSRGLQRLVPPGASHLPGTPPPSPSIPSRRTSGHTLQTTALVHEAFLRLHDQKPAHYENRAHFFVMSAQLMRQILVDHARARKAAKRDAGARLTLEDVTGLIPSRSVDLIELDDALKSLAQLDPQQSLIVDCGSSADSPLTRLRRSWQSRWRR